MLEKTQKNFLNKFNKNLNKFQRYKAFTLAEVLITLGIIGIVAAITIPTLMQNQQEQATVVSLKKSYSILSQAYISAVQEDGTPDNWGFSSNDPTSMMSKITPYLKITKNCGTTISGCFPDQYYELKHTTWVNDSTTNPALAKAILMDGTIIVGVTYNENS